MGFSGPLGHPSRRRLLDEPVVPVAGWRSQGEQTIFFRGCRRGPALRNEGPDDQEDREIGRWLAGSNRVEWHP